MRQIGLMRYGRILAEDEPNHLMEVQNCETLEQVFLILCTEDELREKEVLFSFFLLSGLIGGKITGENCVDAFLQYAGVHEFYVEDPFLKNKVAC